MTSPAGHASHPLHVLVVDDEGESLSVLALLLTSQGYMVTTTSDPSAALETLTRPEPDRPVDVLVTDVCMPGMSGIELIRAARARGADMPTIVVSGHGFGREVLTVVRPIVDAYLAKPFHAADLLGRMRDLVRHAVEPRQL
jgi:DNA-binding response OmpR family regulator